MRKVKNYIKVIFQHIITPVMHVQFTFTGSGIEIWIEIRTRDESNMLTNEPALSFLKMGRPRPLYIYFRSFSNKHQYNFATK